jgi:hypothetical protein
MAMHKLFNDIINLEGVKGVLWLSPDGGILFEKMNVALQKVVENWDWTDFLNAINGLREIDLAFEFGHLYLRKTQAGYLMVFAGSETPNAMLRLNCDILLPALKKGKKPSGGIKRFFKSR